MYILYNSYDAGLILGLRPANERRRYFVTTSLIGWAQTYVFEAYHPSHDHGNALATNDMAYNGTNAPAVKVLPVTNAIFTF